MDQCAFQQHCIDSLWYKSVATKVHKNPALRTLPWSSPRPYTVAVSAMQTAIQQRIDMW